MKYLQLPLVIDQDGSAAGSMQTVQFENPNRRSRCEGLQHPRANRLRHLCRYDRRYGTIIKEYKNANMIYTPSEMVGTKRTGIRNIDNRNARTITTSHVERLNGTQRTFMKRLNRLTLCFSKKLENLEAAFAMFAAYYNYCWRTRKPGNSGMKRPTACMMAGITDHLWSFDELFLAVLSAAPRY